MTKNKIDASEFDKIVECNSILTLDEQYPLEREETESNEASSHTHKTLKMQVATRWNSALMMLESLDCLMDCAMNSLKSLGKFDLLLDEEERDIVHGMVTFLRPFKELTELVSDSNNSLAVIPIVKKRIAELCATNAHDAEEIKSLKKVISGSIDKRFKLSKVATLACMLDPSTRDHIFKKDDVLKTLSKAAKALDNDEDENSSQNLPQSKKMKLLSAIKESTVDDRDASDPKEDEIDTEVLRYYTHKPTAAEADLPLLFWKNNSHTYRTLSVLAKEYLGIPSSSVPVECMFSTTGLIMNSKRSSLNPATLNMITFIHDNLKIFKKD
jgi:hypothetical protein